MTKWDCRLAVFLAIVGFTSALSSMHSKEIYGVPKSGWTSPEWRWGYGVGTGHDCAMICRQMYLTRESRENLVAELLEPKKKTSFEEVKLVLGLAWQNGRWDGSDGGPGGYGEVLTLMAEAQRYENGSEESCSQLLVQDMNDRFHLLNPTTEQLEIMKSILSDGDHDSARRRCAGLVLSAMEFIENGL